MISSATLKILQFKLLHLNCIAQFDEFLKLYNWVDRLVVLSPKSFYYHTRITTCSLFGECLLLISFGCNNNNVVINYPLSVASNKFFQKWINFVSFQMRITVGNMLHQMNFIQLVKDPYIEFLYIAKLFNLFPVVQYHVLC